MGEPSNPARRADRLRRSAYTLFVAAALIALAGFPAAMAAGGAIARAPEIGYAHAIPGASKNKNLTMNLTDMPAFVPKYISANISSNLSIHLVNTGDYDHSFTLSNQSGVALNTSWTPTNLTSYFAKNKPMANVTLDPGQQQWVNLSFNATAGLDSFEFVSIVPYQFQSGMWGWLNISGGPGLYLSDNTTNSLSFVPAVLEANISHFPASLNVQVFNQGSLSHTWTIASQSNVTLSPGNFTTYFASHPPLASSSIPSTAGLFAWANFTITGGGVYQYICTIPGHFAAGMTGYLYVNVAPPPPPVPPSTAIVDEWLLLTVGGVLGIGLILVALAAFIGRIPKSPPSEHGGHY
jgi:uncharacterized cupredoxin-like copper-binding protein